MWYTPGVSNFVDFVKMILARALLTAHAGAAGAQHLRELFPSYQATNGEQPGTMHATQRGVWQVVGNDGSKRPPYLAGPRGLCW
jgi:hypothetical protein